MPLTARSDIEADQLSRLNSLLAEIIPANRYYSPRISAGKFASLAGYFDRVPFTTKQGLLEDQRCHPPFGSNLTYPPERYTRFSQTSGTSGAPMRWLDTPESWNWMLGNWERVYRAAGVGAGDRVFFAFSFGPFLGFWTAFDAASRLGCLCIPGGGMRSSARLRVMLDLAANVLCCTPTYAVHLAEAAVEEGLDPAQVRLKTILVAGEPGGSIPGTRNRIEKLWPGAKVVDHHGMTEIGPVSYGCRSRPGILHVLESSFIAEIIEPATGRHVPRGEPGELVLTNLGRAGMPLIRYRTGDLVQQTLDDVCECGSADLALQGGIIGRTDDMVVVRGVNVHPSAIEDILRSCGGVADYRVQVSANRSLVELSIQVEPERGNGDGAALVHHIETALKTALALRIPVTLVPMGSLPRFEMKAKRWVWQ